MRDDFDRVMCGSSARGLYESHYLRAVHPGGDGAIWIKHNFMAPTDGRGRTGELWAIYAPGPGQRPVVVRGEVPDAEIETGDAPIELRTSAATLGVDRARGELEEEGHHISWDLALEGSDPPLVPAPFRRLYHLPFPKKKLLVQRPSLVLRGRLEVDDAGVDVDGWVGFQGHNWGAEHPVAYAYSTCNLWDQAGSWTWNGFSGAIRLGPLRSPWLCLGVLREPKGELRFDRRWINQSARVRFPSWSCTFQSGDATLRVDTSMDPEEAAGLRYLNPDGSLNYCYNSQYGRLEVVVERRGVAPDRRTSSVAELEFLTPEPIAGIPLHGPAEL